MTGATPRDIKFETLHKESPFPVTLPMVGGPIFLFSKINKVTRARNINQKQKPICTEEKITSIHIEDTSQDLKPRQINENGIPNQGDPYVLGWRTYLITY